MFCHFQELGERVRFLRYVVCHVTLMYWGKTLFLADRGDKTTDWNASSRYISQLVWTIKPDSWFDSCCSASFTERLQSSFLTEEKCIILYCHLRQWFLQKATSFTNRLHQILSVPNQNFKEKYLVNMLTNSPKSISLIEQDMYEETWKHSHAARPYLTQLLALL